MEVAVLTEYLHLLHQLRVTHIMHTYGLNQPFVVFLALDLLSQVKVVLQVLYQLTAIPRNERILV